MSEQLPPQNYDGGQYERPNQNWICGHACEGSPCRLGPTGRGQCRAAPECTPVLEKKEGDPKGRWRCMRPGGACPDGPLPDGKCCRPITRCSPVPTLRWWRGRVVMAVAALTIASLLILLGSSRREKFINPGPLSLAHSGAAFHTRNREVNNIEQNCGACHKAGAAGVQGILLSAWRADPAPTDFAKLAHHKSGVMTPIDRSCQKCHADQSLHRAHVLVGLSCSACHQEHQGAGRMAMPGDDRCILCHGNAEKMAALGAKELESVPPSELRKAGLSATPVITVRAIARNFETDHPEFRIQADHWRDTNTLKFNHALHLAGATIPPLPSGQKLTCTTCHQPDAGGAYVRGIQFANHCQACHSLQFDPETPGLAVPHGNPQFVSAFLRGLPSQYAALAAQSGLATRDEQNKFAQEKIRSLQQRIGTGDELEKRIFFSNATLGPQTRVGSVNGATPALYPGCAYCHEVKSNPAGRPEITRPTMPERWLNHGAFDHLKHANLDCAKCHAAAQSKDTADIILPAKQLCASCHGHTGGVINTCSTCHGFHTKLRK